MKKHIALLLAFATTLSFSACASSGSTSSPAPASTASSQTSVEAESSESPFVSEKTAQWPDFLTVGGGSTGGVFFSAASGIAQLIATQTDCTATAQTTTGGGQNIQLMGKGELEFGIADATVCKEAFEGLATFEGKPNTDIRVIAAIYPAYFQQAVRVGSGIESMNDLLGKRMVVGGPGSGTENSTRKVYTAHGYDYSDKNDLTPEYLGISEGVEKIQNKQADGISAITPFPFSSFTEITMTDEAKLISLTDEGIAKLTEEGSPFVAGVIPAGTYSNQKEDIRTVYHAACLIANADLDEEMVYELTKMMFENTDYLITQHNCFASLNLKDAVTGLTIPLHPGAERYYKEQGVL